MLGIFSISLLFTIIQAVTSQIPEHCKNPPPGVVPTDCCKIPSAFNKQDLKECGMEDPAQQHDKGPEICSKHVCLLKRYNLMKDDENVNKSAVCDFLNDWSNKNIEFKYAIQKAKEQCLQGDLLGPSHMCEASKIGFCIMVITFQECPKMEDTDNCKKLKDHMEQCKPLYQFSNH